MANQNITTEICLLKGNNMARLLIISRAFAYQLMRQGVRADARRLAARLWTAHKYRLRPEVHPSLLDADDARDRKLWQNQQRR